MKCPECGTDDCYIGLQWIHCRNKECKYYDARYLERKKKYKQTKLTKSERLILVRELLRLEEDDEPLVGGGP